MSSASPPPNDPPAGPGNPPTSGETPSPGADSRNSTDQPISANWIPLAQQPPAGESRYIQAELVDAAPSGGPPRGQLPPGRRRRRVRLPLILFLLTCGSTFWVGATGWMPTYYIQESMITGSWMPVRRALISYWDDGLIYMACVLAILLTHEMGHFLATVRYRIPASLPFCIPFPFSPIGTLGAVIGMEGLRADRRQMFDIGLAGPLAGLIVAVPVMWIGIQKLDLTQGESGMLALECPLAVNMTLDYLQPPGYEPGMKIWRNQLNPYFMAGWIGLLITGLNMLPVSQLDGGHVIYTLFGKKAHWIARAFLVLAIAFIVYANAYVWALMVMLVLLIGTDHPPTRDDSVSLGWFRTTLGYVSLAIPIFCFSPGALMIGTQ